MLLINQLQSGYPEIRNAAIKALATCGQRNAVGPLFNILNNSSLSDFIKEKVRYSIMKIKSRPGGESEAGWLSITDTKTEQGALSLNNNSQAGDLSITDNSNNKQE